MSVLDEITRAVTDTARTAAKMSSDMVEVTRLNVAISAEEDKIDKLLHEIGRKVYEKYVDNNAVIDEEIAESCAIVKDYERNIAEMNAKILNLKKVKECSNCKEILDIDMTFCFKCGEKQPVVEIIIEDEETPEPEEVKQDNQEYPDDDDGC